MKKKIWRLALNGKGQAGQYAVEVIGIARNAVKIRFDFPDKALPPIVTDPGNGKRRRPIARETEVEPPPGVETLPEGPLGEVG